MEKMNLADNQKAFEYAMYMIATSYFVKAKCTTPIREGNLFAHYKGLREKAQYALEDVCIDFVEKKLMRELPERIWNETMEVQLVKNAGTGCTELRLEGKKFLLRLMGVYAGRKNTKFVHEIWYK